MSGRLLAWRCPYQCLAFHGERRERQLETAAWSWPEPCLVLTLFQVRSTRAWPCLQSALARPPQWLRGSRPVPTATRSPQPPAVLPRARLCLPHSTSARRCPNSSRACAGDPPHQVGVCASQGSFTPQGKGLPWQGAEVAVAGPAGCAGPACVLRSTGLLHLSPRAPPCLGDWHQAWPGHPVHTTAA